MNVKLHLTPTSFKRSDLADNVAVVIDVLRCTTSICAALSAGARGVIPTIGPGEAVDMWTKLGSNLAILAGEREGVRIENFQLGNSPLEFTAESVGGKLVVMTTTNGTRAFVESSQAALVLSAALVNIGLIADRIVAEGRDVAIVCAGREGGFSIEDTLCGGMLIDLIAAEQRGELDLNDAGSLALLLYRSNKTAIKQSIAQGEHGRYLTRIGFADDIENAAAVDSIPVLPVLQDGRLVLEQ